MTSPIGTIAFLVVAGALFGFCYRYLLRRRASQVDPDWLLEFSADRYAILGRMLDGDDYDWIATQTAGDRHLCEELRAIRRKAFRRYLAELSRDFTRLERISKMIVAGSPEDETELARFLLRQSISFRVQLLVVHLRLAVNPFHPGNIDVRRLLDLIQGTHGRLFWLAAGGGRAAAV